MKYSRVSNDTSHLKHYIKLVTGHTEGVDEDCPGSGLHLALVEEVSKTTDHLPVEVRQVEERKDSIEKVTDHLPVCAGGSGL